MFLTAVSESILTVCLCLRETDRDTEKGGRLRKTEAENVREKREKVAWTDTQRILEINFQKTKQKKQVFH